MKATVNDVLRWLIGIGILCLGPMLSIAEQIKIHTFSWHQQRLRKRYGINEATPVLAYSPELEQRLDEVFHQALQKGKFAFTSGSASRPKRILYSKSRVRRVKRAFTEMFVRCCWSNRIRRTSLYVFSSLSKDESLTSLLLEEPNCPPYLSSLQAPYRLQHHSAIHSLVTIYGATAVRLWILAVANPGVLYSTNPSTISIFLDELNTDWQRSSRLIRDWHQRPGTFDDDVHRVLRRLQSVGSTSRLALIADSDVPLPLGICAPAISTYICWVGGYVKPFLNRLDNYLPAEQYRRVPMYAMSTETLETLTHFENGGVSFLPLAPEVVYEFIEESREDHYENLLSATQLEVGRSYSMVVSDPYGLRRYQTGDLFQCKRFVHGLPDLLFIRRRDLEYSFTGEKLTAEQVGAAFQELRKIFPALKRDIFLTCVPSKPADEPVPHYKTIIINGAGTSLGFCFDQFAESCDQLFSAINREYKNKRDSRRLGRVQTVQMSPAAFIKRTSSARQSSGESQFKFLPLYRNTWESPPL